MTDIVQQDIEKLQGKLRTLDEELGHLGSHGFQKRRFNGPERGGGPGADGRRPIVFNDGPAFKRRRVSENVPEDADDIDEGRPRKSVQSTVVMPAIETKSREEKLEELAKTEKKEVANRNRRMFSNLLMGTLSKFKKEENKGAAERKQAEKLEEVQKKLLEIKRQDKEKIIQERQTLMDERREKEKELRQLTRKKALMQYAEAKQNHYRLLGNFIQTQTKPVIFFLPAKHTVRSLELLKNSQKNIDGLIELRQKDLERELQNTHGHSDVEGDTVKSIVSDPKSKENGKTLRYRRERRRTRSESDDDDKKSEDEKKEEDDEDRKSDDDGEDNVPGVEEKGAVEILED